MKSQRPAPLQHAHTMPSTAAPTKAAAPTTMLSLTASLRPAIVIVLFALIAPLLFAANPVQAQEDPEAPPADAAQPAALRVTGASANMDTTFGSLTGGTATGTVDVTVENRTNSSFSDLIIEVQTSNRTQRASVSIAAGETATFGVPIMFKRGAYGAQDIELSVNGQNQIVTHWNMPWLLIALIALLCNAVLLGIRNLLRNQVRSQLIAVRRSEDLGSALRPSAALPQLAPVTTLPRCADRGSKRLPV